jgi:hypothetical protein
MLALAGLSSLLCACDCIREPAEDALGFSEVAFRGRVEGFRDSGNGYRLVIFKVDRVWKGKIGPTFEMPAVESDELCWAWPPSMLKTGTEIVVFANHMQGGTHPQEFYPMRCETSLPRDLPDLRKLGRGHKPKG